MKARENGTVKHGVEEAWDEAVRAMGKNKILFFKMKDLWPPKAREHLRFEEYRKHEVFSGREEQYLEIDCSIAK